MTLTVVGFTTGTMNTAELEIRIIRSGHSQWLSTMKVLTVQGDDYWRLSEKFGEHANFVLLNDATVEACKAVGFPVGTVLGSIDETEIQNPLRLLGAS